ncbi:MAG: SUMF1/EgtB/PvdO family nonheme iron enzyme [Myxococcota bacterium]|nr:SUMF1/EgtB/PvdO family nonheme iron enzyme [Myxococcota bacterium]
MAKRAPKSPKQPQVEAFDIQSRSGDGVGHGRFIGTMEGFEGLVDVLILNRGHEIPKIREWVQRMQSVEHRALPRVVHLDTSPQLEWVAFEEPDGKPLTDYLEATDGGLAEIETLHVIMQLATALQTAHSHGLLHGDIRPDVIRLRPNEGQLYEVHLTGWLPDHPTASTEPKAVSDDLKALGRLFYQMITGVLPPSAQAEDTVELEGQTSGAFDDVLLDWIEEDRDLKGLGGPALEAMADTSTFNNVAEFLEALLPHFREHLKSTVEATGRALDEDRAFMTEVERQRGRLRELESRQQYLKDWLDERHVRIEECDQELERHVARLRSLEALQTEVALMLGQTATGSTHAIEDVLSSWANDAPIDGLFEDEAFPLTQLEGTDEAEPKPTDLRLGQADPADSAVESYDELSDEKDGHADTRMGLSSAFLTLLVAIIVGAVVAGLFLYQPPPDEQRAPPKENEANQANTAAKDKLSARPSRSYLKSPTTRDKMAAQQETKARQTTPVQAKSMLAANQGPDAGSDTLVGTPLNDLGLDQNVIQAKKMRDAATTTPPDNLGTPPDGMIAVQAGSVRMGLTEAQVDLLKRRCISDLKVAPNRCEIPKEERNTVEMPVDAFFIDRFEVSQREYDRCVKAKKCKPIRTRWTMQTQPATGINHGMASAYCTYQKRRLPTVSEWLYVARGNRDDRVYPWGNEAPKSGDTIRANFGRSDTRRPAPSRADRHYYAAPVETFAQIDSPWGAQNLAGNVREWTATRQGDRAVVVGGGWRDRPTNLRVTRTESVKISVAVNDLGFRCAADPDTEKP